jgi:hypothetical protein
MSTSVARVVWGCTCAAMVALAPAVFTSGCGKEEPLQADAGKDATEGQVNRATGLPGNIGASGIESPLLAMQEFDHIAMALPGVTCPTAAKTGHDADSDEIDDGCDLCPNDPINDPDGDWICARYDNCPLVYNPDQDDSDSDGIGDACDPDFGTGGIHKPDSDSDGILDENDNCPTVANHDQRDSDLDGIGDACDPDADNDGVLNAEDPYPLDRFRCGDSDSDGCDDCAVAGFFMPDNDGPDMDHDGLCNVGDPDADGDGVPRTIDIDDRDPLRCGDSNSDGCDDCSAGHGFDPAHDGPGGGTCRGCDSPTKDYDNDDLCGNSDPCQYSDDNDRDGDHACFIDAEQADVRADAAPPTNGRGAPVIGVAGGVPYVAYQTTSRTIRVLAVEATQVRVLGVINLVADLGTSNVWFKTSVDQLVVAPVAALTDEHDYDVYPYKGLYAVPYQITAAGPVKKADRAAYFDCFGGDTGAPGVAHLDNLVVGDPAAWLLATVSCPIHSLFVGSSQRRVMLGGDIDSGPISPILGVRAHASVDALMAGDDREAVVVGPDVTLSQSIFAPYSELNIEYQTGYTDWRGNLSAGGDALAGHDAAGTWRVLYRPRPTGALRTTFAPLARPHGPVDTAADAGLVWWADSSGVHGKSIRTHVGVGLPPKGQTFAAAEHLVVRQDGSSLVIWR